MKYVKVSCTNRTSTPKSLFAQDFGLFRAFWICEALVFSGAWGGACPRGTQRFQLFGWPWSSTQNPTCPRKTVKELNSPGVEIA